MHGLSRRFGQRLSMLKIMDLNSHICHMGTESSQVLKKNVRELSLIVLEVGLIALLMAISNPLFH